MYCTSECYFESVSVQQRILMHFQCVLPIPVCYQCDQYDQCWAKCYNENVKLQWIASMEQPVTMNYQCGIECYSTINCQYGVENYNELPVWSGYLQWNSVPVSSRELLYNGFECWAKFTIHFSRQHYDAWSHFSLQTKSLFRTKCLVWAIHMCLMHAAVAEWNAYCTTCIDILRINVLHSTVQYSTVQ